MGIFRKEIRGLALSSKSPFLKVVNVEKLTQEDFLFYTRFKKGALTIEQVEAQEKVIPNIPETQTQLGLLAYMKHKLAH